MAARDGPHRVRPRCISLGPSIPGARLQTRADSAQRSFEASPSDTTVENFSFGMEDHIGEFRIGAFFVFCTNVCKRLPKCAPLRENSVYEGCHHISMPFCAPDQVSKAIDSSTTQAT